MTSAVQGEQKPKETTVRVDKTATVAGRSGPQWELTVVWPWTNKVPDRIWVDKTAMPNEPALGNYRVQVVRLGVKRNKEGPYDGTQDWMWNYRVVAWDGPATAPLPLAAPAAQPAPAASMVPTKAPAAPEQTQESPVPQNSVPWTRYFPFGDLMARAMEMRREVYGDTYAQHPGGAPEEYSQQLAWCYAALVAMVRGEQEKP